MNVLHLRGKNSRIEGRDPPVVRGDSDPKYVHQFQRRVREDRGMGEIKFRAQLQRRGPAAAVVLDDEQVAAVGEGAKRFPVVATVNGYTWRTSVARMGGEFLVGLNREVRDGAGVEAGDEVGVSIALDQAP